MKTKINICLMACLMILSVFMISFSKANAVTMLTEDSCVTPPSDMVSWWPGDGNANDIKDGNNGTAEGNTSYVAGKVDQAFSFDGDADYVDAGTGSNLNLRDAMTLDAWIYLNDVPEEDGWFFVTGKETFELYIYHNDPEEKDGIVVLGAYLLIDGNEYDLWQEPGISLQTGQWYHVAGTFDGNTIKTYVNGVLDVDYDLEEAGTIDDSSQSNFLIGGIPDYNQSSFYGMIDEVEVFSRALEQSEIQSIYNADSAGKCKEATQPSTPVITYPSNGSTINTQTPTIKGTATAGNTVLLTVASDPHSYSVTADGNGNWELAIPESDKLASGEHYVTAQARDGQGSLSGTATNHFTVSLASSIPVSGGENMFTSIALFILFILGMRFAIAKFYNKKF